MARATERRSRRETEEYHPDPDEEMDLREIRSLGRAERDIFAESEDLSALDLTEQEMARIRAAEAETAAHLGGGR